MRNFAAIWKTAWRGLRRQPGFALLAVLTLAVGIGPTTAVYAVFRQVLLRELPVPRPQQLVLLHEHSGFETGSLSTYGGENGQYFAVPAYRALRAAYPALGAAALQPVDLSTASAAQRVSAQLVSGSYFAVMGEKPLLGRLLTENDDRMHAGNPAAVLSAAYWRSHFGSDPSVLNMPITVNGAGFTVVGVAPEHGLIDDEPADVFVPLAEQKAISLGGADTETDALNRWVVVVGRMPAGAARASILAKLRGVWTDWRRDVLHTRNGEISDPKGWMRTSLTLGTGARGISDLSTQLGTPLRMLQAMALIVLLVVCANLANLLLARAAKQRGETAVRAALGAGRWQAIARVAADGLLIGMGGTVLGCALGWLSLRLLAGMLPNDSSTGLALAAPFAWPVLLFAAGAGLLTSLLFTLAPAMMQSRINPVEALRGQGGVVRGSEARARNLMVALSIALSVLLLMSATLFGWNLYKLSTVKTGFRVDRLLLFNVDESQTGASNADTAQVYNDLLSDVVAHAHVESAAYARQGLITGDQWGGNISVEGRPNKGNDPSPDYNAVTPGFFRTLGIPVLRGREFGPDDTAGSGPVAIVDQDFVRVFFNGDAARALGAYFGFGASTDEKYRIRIVGIVPTVHEDTIKSLPPVPYLYLAYAQTFGNAMKLESHPASFFVRTSGNTSLLAADVRAEVHRLDPKLPLLGVKSMRQQISDSIADTRLMALLSAGLGGLAVLLAAIGLYGVLAYQVATRTREIGLRMAVGASRMHVATLMLHQMLRLTLLGMTLGAAVSWGLARLLHSQTAALLAPPPWMFVAAGLVLLLAALLATLVPAWRAARVEPMEALRTE